MLIPFSRRFVICAIVLLPWVIAWTNAPHQAGPQFVQLAINWEQIDAATLPKADTQLPRTLLVNLKLDPTSSVDQTTGNYPTLPETFAKQSTCEPPQSPQIASAQSAVITTPPISDNVTSNFGPKKLVCDDAATSVENRSAAGANAATESKNVLRSFRSPSTAGIQNRSRPQPVMQATDAAPVETGQAPSPTATLETAAPAQQAEPAKQSIEAGVVDENSESMPLRVSSEASETFRSTEVDLPADTSATDSQDDVVATAEIAEIASAPAENDIPSNEISTRIASQPTPVEAGEYDNPIQESIAPNPYRPNSNGFKNDEHAPLVMAVKSPDDLMKEVWWSDKMKEPLRSGTVARPLDLDALLVRTLMHSAQIQVFSELPLIRETAVTEASANFDWRSFTESLWNDVSDPVGSSLTVGGNATRFRDHKVTAITGVRRRNPVGGQVEFNQEFGQENSNSNFFIPNNQGTARLRMSYTHPLLRGSGRVYNQSLIVLAEVDTSMARDELIRQVSGHLLEVTRAYWGLALERATYLQKVRLYESSRGILENLEARRELDTYRSQIVRAQAAVSSRESDLIRAEVAIRNAEARIRALVNDARLGNDQTTELIPMDQPISYDLGVELQETLTVAMQKRPEVAQAFKQIRAASVRENMTKNELLPTLNLLLTSYVSGLQGNSNVGQAWSDQFSVGEPSYSVGLNLEVPLGNRAARARELRRRLELRQFESQLRLTMETVNLEVGVAVRETIASFQEMRAKYRAMQAAEEDNQYVQKRWELLPGENANASLVFDELIRTQQRLTEAEEEFVAAQTTYNLSLTNLKKAAGILLETEQVATARTVINGVPTIIFDKSDIPAVGEPHAPSLDSPAEILEAPAGGNAFPPE